MKNKDGIEVYTLEDKLIALRDKLQVFSEISDCLPQNFIKGLIVDMEGILDHYERQVKIIHKSSKIFMADIEAVIEYTNEKK